MSRQLVIQTRTVYGGDDEEDDDYVHEEVVELGKQAKTLIQDHLQRTPTTEAAVIAGVSAFGPSKQSRKILNRENKAAEMAFKDKIYIVWRLFGAPRLSGANNDFCCRIGPVHRCFCGHSLRQHATPSKSSHGFTQKHACQAEGCACACYRYVPNEPEEIGEGFLSRRQGFNPKTWSAKCQCQHGHLAHDPKTQKCSACGCGFFQSNFLCVVCDCPWEDHSTVFETEEERERQSLPVREAYFPLVNLDWELRAQVLSDPTGGGLLSPRSFAPIDGERRRSRRISHRPDMEALEEERNIWNAAEKWDLVDYCHSCATIFKSPESAFCSHCGAKRRR